MAQFRLASGGGVPTFLIDTADGFSKDPGPNSAPTAGPNTPVNTGGAKTVQVNYSETSGGTSNQVLASIQNPG
jgi:hypothetical protein